MQTEMFIDYFEMYSNLEELFKYRNERNEFA